MMGDTSLFRRRALTMLIDARILLIFRALMHRTDATITFDELTYEIAQFGRIAFRLFDIARALPLPIFTYFFTLLRSIRPLPGDINTTSDSMPIIILYYNYDDTERFDSLYYISAIFTARIYI